MKPQAKVSRVMREFKKGDLKSSSGQKVTNPKQAIAIGLSEAGISKKAKGGEMKESKAMMKKEVSFMKKKGAPKSMLKHEMAEMKGMKKGGYAGGGMPMVIKDGKKVPAFAADGEGKMKKGGAVKKMGMGGSAVPYGLPPGVKQALQSSSAKMSTRPALATKSFGMQLGSGRRMASGGLAAGHKSADGIARKGKTKAEQVKMAKGGTAKMRKGGYC